MMIPNPKPAMTRTETEQHSSGGAALSLAESLAADVVQTMADSEPDGDTIEAQDLLAGTPYESMFVVHSHVIERAVALVIENAIYDGILTSITPKSDVTKP